MPLVKKTKQSGKECKGKKTFNQDTFDKQLLPSTPNKALEFNGTHMAFVDQQPIQNTSSMHINVSISN